MKITLAFVSTIFLLNFTNKSLANDVFVPIYEKNRNIIENPSTDGPFVILDDPKPAISRLFSRTDVLARLPHTKNKDHKKNTDYYFHLIKTAAKNTTNVQFNGPILVNHQENFCLKEPSNIAKSNNNLRFIRFSEQIAKKFIPDFDFIYGAHDNNRILCRAIYESLKAFNNKNNLPEKYTNYKLGDFTHEEFNTEIILIMVDWLSNAVKNGLIHIGDNYDHDYFHVGKKVRKLIYGAPVAKDKQPTLQDGLNSIVSGVQNTIGIINCLGNMISR